MRLLSLLFALVGFASNASALKSPRKNVFFSAPRPQVTALETVSPAVGRPLAVRGGAGPLDSVVVAKVATSILLFNGLLFGLCPEAANNMYDSSYVPDPNLAMVLKHNIGWGSFVLGLFPYFVLFHDASAKTAIGRAILACFIQGTTTIINGDPAKLGGDSKQIVPWLLLNAAILYGLSTDASWVTNLIKGFAAVGGLPFLLQAVNPAAGLKLFGVENMSDGHMLMSYRSQACYLLGSFSLMWNLINGMEVTKALGYAHIPTTLGLFACLFITKDYEKMGVEGKGPYYFWLLVSSVIVGTLAF